MTVDLTKIMPSEELEAMHRSWEAWSATNIMFTPDGKLVLGLRTVKPESIPEPGDYALVGGFNTLVAPPAMRRDVADAHAKDQLNIDLVPGQSSTFLPCEYEMSEIKDPLKTSNGPIHIKRTAFDRITLLTKEQVESLQPQGKLKGVECVTEQQFERLVESGKLSFHHQIEHVRMAFKLRVHERGLPDADGWTYGYQREAMAAFLVGDLMKFSAIMGPCLVSSEEFQTKLANMIPGEKPPIPSQEGVSQSDTFELRIDGDVYHIIYTHLSRPQSYGLPGYVIGIFHKGQDGEHQDLGQASLYFDKDGNAHEGVSPLINRRVLDMAIRKASNRRLSR